MKHLTKTVDSQVKSKLKPTNGTGHQIISQSAKRIRREDRETGALLVSADVIIEMICALHLACFVESPFKDRGGLMMVGPPGKLKTQFLDILDDNFHNAVSHSNCNSQTITKMAPEMYSGEIRSLVFPDLQALYAGDLRTATRMEQVIMQLTGESHRGASYQDARFQKFRARCMVFAALTPAMQEEHSKKWEASGFLRRFLWATYTLKDASVLIRAIQRWERADMGRLCIPDMPANRSIRDRLTEEQRREITSWLKHQPGPHEIQLQVLCKAASVLYWHYERNGITRDAMDTVFEFSSLLQKNAALVELPGDVKTVGYAE